MKYKEGDLVRIKSIDWYNENKNSVDNYDVVFADGWHFSEPMSIFCGKELIIEIISHATNSPHYRMKDNIFAWTDEMIECKVEEEVGLVDNLSSRWVNEFNLPNGYIFKDENGNVINATKIVLEKKKKEYPKTYEECYQVTGLSKTSDIYGYKNGLLFEFQKLLIARDAYWKIAGEEMGLGKPWSPTDSDYTTGRYCILVFRGNIIYSTPAQDCILTFPTEEMRNAFYENFKEEIESCKEFL